MNFDQNSDQNKVFRKKCEDQNKGLISRRKLHSGQALPSVGMRRHTLRRTYRIPRNYLIFDGLPTPTEEADGNGYGVIAGWRGPSIEAATQSERVKRYLVPLTAVTGVRLRLNLRADRQEPLPMFRCPGLRGVGSAALWISARLLLPPLATERRNSRRVERSVSVCLGPLRLPWAWAPGATAC